MIGTEGTIESKAYAEAIHYLDPAVEVFGQACPLIVPIVEEGWINKPLTKDVVKEYLGPLLQNNIDTMVLGCTHYPLMKNVLANIAGPTVKLIDSALETAIAVAQSLKENHLEAMDTSGSAVYRFYVSDDADRFERAGRRFLGRDIPGVNQVDIGTWL